MDSLKSKIENYKTVLAKYIQDLAKKYNDALGNKGNYHAIVDLQSNHFQLVKMTWHNDNFIHIVLIHLSINSETGNIWIHQNETEIDVDIELEKIAKIPKKHFVLGFYPDYAREHSDYAVA